MLTKLLNVYKLTSFSRNESSKPTPTAPPTQPKTTSSALKIVHAGGIVECYYMTIPAYKIMEKYPSFILARPEVFRRPWDSVVRPDEILTPGEKFFLVPRRTVKKLWRRIKRPDRDTDRNVSVDSYVSNFSSIDVSVDVVSCGKSDFSCQSFCQQSEVRKSSELSGSFRKKTAIRKHVRFIGIEVVKQKASGSHDIEEKNNKLEEKDNERKCLNSQSHKQKRRPRNTAPAWEPSLAAINERADESFIL